MAVVLTLAAVYFAAAKLGLTMAFVAEQVTAVWPPTGIGLAAILLFGSRVWPGIVLGAFLANVTTHTPSGTALGIAVGNTLEAVAGAWLLRRFIGFDPSLQGLKDVLGLVVLAAVVSTTISATLGVTALCLGGVQPWTAFGSLWWVWWLGDATGDLVMAPVLLTWATTRRSPWRTRRPLEAGALVLTLVVMTLAVFGGLFAPESTTHPLVYTVFPFIIWAALRFGQVGTTTVTFIASGIAIWSTVNGLGPFAKETVNESLNLLLIFMAVVAVTGLLLGGAIAENRRAERRAAAQYATASILAEARTLEEATTRLLEAIGRNLDWDIGVLWTVDQAANELRFFDLWHAPMQQAPEFEAESRKRRFTPGTGLPGRVWATAKPHRLTNVIEDSNVPRLSAAAREGLQSAFGVPIIVGNEVLGVMEFFSHAVRPPDDDFLGAMAALGQQVGQFIERKRVEEACLASEARKSAIVETALDCIITIDHEGRIVEFNPAAEATFGYRRSDVLGQPMAKLIIPPHLREAHYRGMSRYLETGEGPLLDKRIEVTALNAGGWVFPAELAISAIRGGHTTHFTAYLRDITERKMWEERLEQSEERYRTFVEQSSEGIWRLEAEMPIAVDRPEDVLIEEFYRLVSLAECNDAMAQTYGFASAAEIIGARLEAFLPRSDPRHVAYLQRFIRSGFRMSEAESHEVDKHGNAKYFLNNLVGIIEDGKLVRAWGTRRDISERKRAEEALRENETRIQAALGAAKEAEEQLRSITDTVPALISYIDKDGIYRLNNLAYENWFGRPRSQITGRHVSDVVGEAAWEKIRPHFEQALSGKTSTYEAFVPYKDGGHRWIRASNIPRFNPRGEVLGAVVLVLDITERKVAEEALRRSEEGLRTANRHKDEFLAMLAHELRNPLACIKSAVTLLGIPGAEADIDWTKEVIERQAGHLARIIDDLLDVSRITRGLIQLRKVPIDALPALDHAVEAVRYLIDERKHTLIVSFPPGPLHLEADPTRLEQIVVNLLTNAAKYSKPGGCIWLEAGLEADQIVIRVRDTGIGIPPERLPQMFELFVQGDRALARSEGGLGLGLTIVKRLAELHGGSVTAKSEGPGRGSEFTVRLPAAERPTTPLTPTTPTTAGGRKRGSRVLVVDDNADMARGLAKLLRLLGHDVQTAYEGRAAIEVARASRPDYILLDIGLPGMDGYEVAQELRKEESCEGAVLIAITGYGQEKDRRRAKEAGFDHHLVKPIDYNALVALISQPA